MSNEELIEQLKEELNGLEPGTEEHKRVADEIVALSSVVTSDKKVDNEVTIKKEDGKKTIIATSITAGGLFLGVAVKEILKFIMNNKVIKGEKDGDYYQHNPYEK